MPKSNQQTGPCGFADDHPRLPARAAVIPSHDVPVKGHSGVRQRADWEIAAEARAALRFSLGTMSSSRLTASVENGALSLFGSVHLEIEKSTALDCVGTVPGVLRIWDHIVLLPAVAAP